MARLKLLCDAVPFGYGPMAKLLAIVQNLNRGRVETTFLGSSTSLELAKTEVFDHIVRCDTETREGLTRRAEQFTPGATLLTVMNPAAAAFANERGMRVICVDSLFWMWQSVPVEAAYAALYVIQNFPGVEQRLKEYGPAVANPLVVGPIVDRRHKRRQLGTSRKILINLGGLESHLIKPGRNSNYVRTIARILSKAFGDRSDELYIRGGEKGLQFFSEDLSAVCSDAKRVSHDDFLSLLSRSALLITSPGLTATLEAFTYGVPVLFLPPQNYSQFFNLNILRAAGAAEASVHLTDYYASQSVVLGMSEEEGVSAVADLLRRLEEDSVAQEDAALRLNRYINESDLEQLAQQQSAFVRSLGVDGTRTVTAAIDAVL